MGGRDPAPNRTPTRRALAAVLNLGNGLVDPLVGSRTSAPTKRWSSTPKWITSSTVLDALDYVVLRLGGHELTMAINKAPRRADLGIAVLFPGSA
jgi:hypothetical protein